MQDGVRFILQARAMANQLGAPSELAAQRLGRRIWYPDLWKKSADVQLCQSRRVDLVGLDFRVRNQTNLQWVRDHDAPNERTNGADNGKRVRRGFEYDLVVRLQTTAKGL